MLWCVHLDPVNPTSHQISESNLLLWHLSLHIVSELLEKKMVFLTNESANKAEINILSARDTTRPGP